MDDGHGGRPSTPRRRAVVSPAPTLDRTRAEGDDRRAGPFARVAVPLPTRREMDGQPLRAVGLAELSRPRAGARRPPEPRAVRLHDRDDPWTRSENYDPTRPGHHLAPDARKRRTASTPVGRATDLDAVRRDRPQAASGRRRDDRRDRDQPPPCLAARRTVPPARAGSPPRPPDHPDDALDGHRIRGGT